MFGFIINTALSPIRDAVDILDGLSDGELREKAAVRLGVDIVAGMTAGEILDYLKNLND